LGPVSTKERKYGNFLNLIIVFFRTYLLLFNLQKKDVSKKYKQNRLHSLRLVLHRKWTNTQTVSSLPSFISTSCFFCLQTKDENRQSRLHILGPYFTKNWENTTTLISFLSFSHLQLLNPQKKDVSKKYRKIVCIVRGSYSTEYNHFNLISIFFHTYLVPSTF
jgi:hypothetical protein